MAVAVIKDQGVIVQARREVQPYTTELSDPKAEDTFNAALKSSEGQARIEQNKAAINDAAKEIDALLIDVGRRRSAPASFTHSRDPRLCLSPARPRTNRGGAASMRSAKCGANEA